MSSGSRLPVLVDADVGVDDALALAFLSARPELELVAVGSVQGNCAAVTAARNALRVLESLGVRELPPVAVGAGRPLAGEPRPRPEVHGADGLGDAGLPPPASAPTAEHAADQVVRLGRERPGELTLLALGPLTNLALALDADAHALERYRSIVATAGLPPPGGAASPDVNTEGDREAARRVLAAAGERLTLIGVEVTRELLLDEHAVAAVAAATTPQARLATRVLPRYLDRYERLLGRRACPLHDPAAAALAADPRLVRATARDPATDATVVTAVDGARVAEQVVAALVGSRSVGPG